MPAPSLESTAKELIEVMRSSATESRDYKIAQAFLVVKNQRAMTRATWAVAFATAGLILATAVSVVVALLPRA